MLTIPAVSRENSNPLIEAESNYALYGDTIEMKLSATAESGQPETVFLLSAEELGAGLSDEYIFDEADETILTAESGNPIILHREEQDDGKMQYWFNLPKSTTEKLTLNCVITPLETVQPAGESTTDSTVTSSSPVSEGPAASAQEESASGPAAENVTPPPTTPAQLVFITANGTSLEVARENLGTEPALALNWLLTQEAVDIAREQEAVEAALAQETTDTTVPPEATDTTVPPETTDTTENADIPEPSANAAPGLFEQVQNSLMALGGVTAPDAQITTLQSDGGALSTYTVDVVTLRDEEPSSTLFDYDISLFMSYNMLLENENAAFNCEYQHKYGYKINYTIIPSDEHASYSYTITINNSDPDYNYAAYQIFTGDYADGTLSNITAWGNGVDSAALITALRNDPTIGSNFPAATVNTAAEFAQAMSGLTSNSQNAEILAKLVSEYLSTAAATATAPAAGKYTMSVPAGYYLVKNTKAPTGYPTSRFMLQVVGDVTVDPKADKPTIDKDIVDEDGNDPVDANTVSIGDTVYYKIESAVPNMIGYEKYFFVMSDTLSKGLTYSANSLVVKINNVTLTKGTDYTFANPVTDSVTGITKMEIVFTDFVNRTEAPGTAIEVFYSATLNEDAVTGKNPNTNEVFLTYSSDPTKTSVGTPGNPDFPDDNDPTGETPKSTTYTYTTVLQITKTDEDGDILPGAEFTLTGDSMNIVLVSQEKFTENTAGDYHYNEHIQNYKKVVY